MDGSPVGKLRELFRTLEKVKRGCFWLIFVEVDRSGDIDKKQNELLKHCVVLRLEYCILLLYFTKADVWVFQERERQKV